MELNKIYNMDCLYGMRQLPDNCVDLVVTDPPYVIETSGAGIYKQADKQYVKELIFISFAARNRLFLFLITL